PGRADAVDEQQVVLEGLRTALERVAHFAHRVQIDVPVPGHLQHARLARHEFEPEPIPPTRPHRHPLTPTADASALRALILSRAGVAPKAPPRHAAATDHFSPGAMWDRRNTKQSARTVRTRPDRSRCQAPRGARRRSPARCSTPWLLR